MPYYLGLRPLLLLIGGFAVDTQLIVACVALLSICCGTQHLRAAAVRCRYCFGKYPVVFLSFVFY